MLAGLIQLRATRAWLIVGAFWLLTTRTADAQTEPPIRYAWFVDFSPTGESLVTSYGAWLAEEVGEVRVWDVKRGRATKVLTSPRGVRAATWSAQGTYIASANYAGTVVLYDSRTGEEKLQVSTGHTAECVQITPDERSLIAASGNGTVRVWDIATGELRHSMQVHQDSIWGMRIASDSKTLATACKNGTVGVSDIESGKQLLRLPHPSVTLGVLFTPDVRQLVTGCRDAQIRVWDLQTGKILRSIRGHSSSVNDLDFSPSGKLLASSSSDRTVRLWDFASGRLLATLEGHEHTAYGVRFSPDGKLVASGSWDGMIKLWDVEKGEEIATLPRVLPPLPGAAALKQTARESFAAGDLAKGHEQLTQLLDAYRQQRGGDIYQWAERLSGVALEYLHAGELDHALTLLGEVADLRLPSHKETDGRIAVAMAALNRRLAALDVEERYELLRTWSLPTDSRHSLRALTSVVPTHAPAAVFARAIGERPRRESFSVARVGAVRGLFSTSWQLVTAANETGRLRQLSSDAAAMAEQDSVGSQILLALITIVEAERPSEETRRDIRKRITTLRAMDTASTSAVSVIAAACLSKQALLPLGSELVRTITEQETTSQPMLALLRQAEARTRLAHQSHTDVVGMPDWVVASRDQLSIDARTPTQEVWLSHEAAVLRLAGSQDTALLLPYPVAGDLELSCELLEASGAAGGVVHGGLVYSASGQHQELTVSDVDGRTVVTRAMSFVRETDAPQFQRVMLRSRGGTTSFVVNGHPVWSDETKGDASPWIGLAAPADETAVYRNLRISGTPPIPREVRLSDDRTLRGWLAGYYRETGPEVLPTRSRSALTATHWYGRDGVISGGEPDEMTDTTTQSRLAYFRPLQDGESVSYEFLYEPDRYHVHPALGRLAFLIEPQGVRLHWMTTNDDEWTGLPPTNAVVEPLNRRGPKPLPLIAGDWNRVHFSVSDRKLTLSLNDTTIYTRPIEPEDSRTFSLYHDRSRSAVRVRNVVLRGDWPEAYAQADLNKLVAPADSRRTVDERRVLGESFDERHVADAAYSVHQRAMAMPPEERYKLLSDWVLPSPGHGTLRLAMDFAPTNPAPPVREDHPFDEQEIQAAVATGESRVQTGGFPVAPAFDLVATAAELGKLPDVRAQVDQTPVTTELEQRRRLAMLALVDIARGDFEAALTSIDDLHLRVKIKAYDDYSSRWPETLAVWVGIHHSETRDGARGLLSGMLQNQVRDGHARGPEQWDRMVAALSGRLEYLDRIKSAGHSSGRFTGRPQLRNWSPVSRTTALTRGFGFPRTHWAASPGAVEKLACHNEDYLMYRLPLRGNFEVECDVTDFSWRNSHLSVAGTWAAPTWGLDTCEIGSFRSARPSNKIDPRMTEAGDWNRYRVVVRDGVSTTYFNGRQIHEQPLAAEHDPWIAIRSPWYANSGVRDLHITGDPIIPEYVRLSALPDLAGWTPYFNESVGTDWRVLEGEEGGGIIAGRNSDLTGSGQESLLRYQRPMLEDGTIEYDFFHREGSHHVHPTLDRRAFMLEPNGVRIHWVTDGVFDHTGLDPLNTYDEPAYRRGPDALPLKSNDWNRLRLSLKGDQVTLALNEQVVYTCELDPTNQRTFGLFRYADRSEARVRNIVWRGDWPRQLPSIEQQALARSPIEAIDEGLPRLTARVRHDFATDGLPPDRFGVYGGTNDWRADVVPKPDGLHFRRPGISGYSSYWLGAKMRVHGDFDITATLDNLTIQASERGSGGLSLTAVLDNKGYTHGTIYRGVLINAAEPLRQIIQSEFVRSPDGQTRMSWIGTTGEEATSGVMRLARRGDKLHCLFAEDDSSHYRLVHTEQVGDESLVWEGVRLTAAVQADGKRPGSTAVIWKDLTVRAERITDWSGTIEQVTPQGNTDE